MMAWGIGCGSWDDSVDDAYLLTVDFNVVEDDKFVMTSWHEAEPLSETFWFAGHAACHPTVSLGDTVIIDISLNERETQLLDAYSAAQNKTL